MRDYSDLPVSLRCCISDSEPCEHCNCELEECNPKIIMGIAADAIEELLARVSENEWRVCENCSLQHFDSDGMRWCEELSMVVGGNFYCGFFEGSEPPKEVLHNGEV